MATNPVSTDVIAEFGRKYLWWEPVDGQPHSEARIIAQTMNLATYDDILLLEETVGTARLLEVMLRAEPGWINDRSWEFWRGRLSFKTGAAIPNEAPRRAFFAVPPAQRAVAEDKMTDKTS
jgi:hypothetical protein